MRSNGQVCGGGYIYSGFYGHAKHAFTFVGADIPEFGVKYDEKAHHRSEISINNFLEEIFK